ncbi:MAG: rod shape-determining protein RodA [Alphaproteobacteria bacterium]|nr:MAG: rod shape-determining protein RodA [Alphaproteobacteria bacterium]
MINWFISRTHQRKIRSINPWIVGLLTLIACIGFAILYSAGGGHLKPWASRQIVRFGVGLSMMIAIALVDIRFWFRNAYLMYFWVLGLLIVVELFGLVGMGAQRWINLYFFHLQPSELMKISLVVALARYFYGLSIYDTQKLTSLMPAFALVFIPALFILKQPDLGTALVLIMVGCTLIYYSGLPNWIIGMASTLVLAAMPLMWNRMHGYQKNRVLTFLDPGRDPLGAGYHQLQSKIALGSGGIFGKGFLEGTQSHLNFLPEKQTDFVFTMYSEEFGFIGGVFLLILYAILIAYGYTVSTQCRNRFGSLLAAGISTILFIYVIVNVGMVAGLLPVVGVPLPLVSYGGTSMITVLMGMGFIISVDIHKNRLSTF